MWSWLTNLKMHNLTKKQTNLLQASSMCDGLGTADSGIVQQCHDLVFVFVFVSTLGGERNRYKNFRIRFRQCRYRISGRKKNGEFVNLYIDFREDIFPVYFYSESESNSLKSIQRVTNSPVFFLPDILYRHTGIQILGSCSAHPLTDWLLSKMSRECMDWMDTPSRLLWLPTTSASAKHILDLF